MSFFINSTTANTENPKELTKILQEVISNCSKTAIFRVIRKKFSCVSRVNNWKIKI